MTESLFEMASLKKRRRVLLFFCTSIFSLICLSPAAFSQNKKVKVWVLHQKNRWGKYKVCVNNKAIRINGSSGGVVIAKAPNWEVFVFHKRDKKFCTATLSQWIRKTNGRLYLPKLKQKPKYKSVSGLKISTYRFPINAVMDVTAGTQTVYRSRGRSTFVKDSIFGFYINQKRVSKAACLVWNGFYEFPNTGVVPIEYYYVLKNNQKIFGLTTSSQIEKLVDPAVFERPVGLKKTTKPILSVFMGSGLMDATELLFPTDKH